MKLLNQIFLFVFLSFLFACSYDVYVKRDGSAHVKITYGVSKDFKNNTNIEYPNDDSLSFSGYTSGIISYYKSKAIKNLQIDSSQKNQLKLEFDINNIDSLGNYLSPVFPYSARFKMENNKLIITGSNGKAHPNDDIGGYTNLLAFSMNLRFERSIKKIRTENSFIKLIDKNTVLINSSLGEMDYSGKLNQLTVELE